MIKRELIRFSLFFIFLCLAEDDGPLELQGTARFRDRTWKRDSDREKGTSERAGPSVTENGTD